MYREEELKRMEEFKILSPLEQLKESLCGKTEKSEALRTWEKINNQMKGTKL